MDKTILILSEILDEHYYKDWVQDELRDVGLPISGDKDELIPRFLNSRAAQRTSVNELGRRLVETLRLAELRQIAEHVGSTTQGGRDQILRGILDTVAFEPFVKHIRRRCGVCSRERLHELHFGDEWQADYFVCEVCRSRTPAQVPIVKNDRMEGPKMPVLLQTTEIRLGHDSPRGSALAIAIGVVGIFLTVASATGPAYGWALGIALGFAVTIIAGYMLIRTRKLWEPRLLKWVQ